MSKKIIKITPSHILNVERTPVYKNKCSGVTVAAQRYYRYIGTVSNVIDLQLYEVTQNNDNQTIFTEIKDFSNIDGVTVTDTPSSIDDGSKSKIIKFKLSPSKPCKFTELTVNGCLSQDYVIKVDHTFQTPSLSPWHFVDTYADRSVELLSNDAIQWEHNFRIYTANNAKYLINVQVSIEGKYYTSGDSSEIKIGAVDAKTINLPTNELVQSNNTRMNQNYVDTITNAVYQRYKNGKETAKLLCIADKYYYTDNTLAIDPDTSNNNVPVLIKKYDIVQPYIHSVNGAIPLGKYSDGTAKNYEVTGVNIKYVGVLRQELILQEIPQETT